MFRTRVLLAALVALAVLPLTGCLNRRCCGGPTVSYSPAPTCSNCASTSAAPPLVVGP